MSFNCCSEIEKGFSFRKDSFFRSEKKNESVAARLRSTRFERQNQTGLV